MADGARFRSNSFGSGGRWRRGGSGGPRSAYTREHPEEGGDDRSRGNGFRRGGRGGTWSARGRNREEDGDDRPRGAFRRGGRGGPRSASTDYRGGHPEEDGDDRSRGNGFRRGGRGGTWRHHEEDGDDRSRRGGPRSDEGQFDDEAPNSRPHRGGRGGRDRDYYRRQFEEDKVLRFKKLEELSCMDPEEIVIELVLKRNGFRDLLDSKALTDDTLVLIIRVLVKVCSVPLKTHKMSIINLALNENFQRALQNCILQMMFATGADKRRAKYFWDDAQGFFDNALAVFQSSFETSPTRACEVVTKTMEVCNHTLEKLDEVTKDTKEQFRKLHEKMTMYVEEIEIKKAAEKTTSSRDEHYEEPPDNFRELAVYPTYDEIMSNAFVRKNLIDRPYNSVDHYLDVQFRLLKEDFVGPLREGISEYLKCDQPFARSKKFSNVRIHKDVTFISPFCSKDQTGVLLQFEQVDRKQKKKERKKYSYSKRFMFGSLVCFTRNNFEDLLFGRIIERDQQRLDKGQVVVGFEPGYDDYVLNEPYLMVECSVYFEPYYHVLKALQGTSEEDFAMKKYIIDVDPNIVRPRYLDDQSSYRVDNMHVALFQEPWPTAARLGLNDSQHSAFKAGLTQEYVVIQGPPGTGKTFLGLKLAETFINNETEWRRRSPMLVVCYTNHALDQFLEGIVPTTDRVIRIGGQSKSKDLERFNLREKRKEVSDLLRGRGYGKALYQFRNVLADFMRQIKNCGEQLEQIRNGEGVLVNFDEFAKVDPTYPTSWFSRAKDEEITSWLLERRRAPGGEFRRRVKVDADDDAQREFDELQNEELMANVSNNQEDLLSSYIGIKVKYLFRVEDMQEVAMILRAEVDFLEEEQRNMVYSKRLELIKKIVELEDDIEYVQNRFEEYRNIAVKTRPRGCNLNNPSEMSANDRWMLYFHWLQLYENHLVRQLAVLEAGRREVHKQYTELQHLQDVEVMRQMIVVGMTTTGAARLQTVLQSLRSPIVIVEEAAEVLEAHIIASLTSHCQHLILIGDHQQLKPSTANYKMEVRFNLGISLFERMVRNHIQCHTLGVQHRMRPEIARLIVPAVYPKLDNHPSVENFPNVKGVDFNLFFIDHGHKEEEVHDSKVNRHEVSYLIALARHLILNGYQPEDITILAAYSAQMFALWEERKRSTHLLRDVRIAVLDNYQGEESEIILLSLVRNNDQGSIGFLKIENRVCVALSRAREGLYIMGNMSMLCKASEIWKKIKTVLVDQKSLGPSLRLRCQIHTRNATEITDPADFENVSEGGCNTMCESMMKCGHVCPKVCHILDRQHENIACKANCIKILCDMEHVCPKMCYEECGPCMVPMKRTLKCTHVISVTCSTDLETVKCMQRVTAKLPCGHTDSNKLCHTPADVHVCPFPCTIRVEPCGHACSLSCHIRDDPDHLNYECRKKCEKPARGCSTGDHKCRKDCCEECSLCEVIVEKRRTNCTHRLQIPCNEDPNLTVCKMACRRMLPCGHACKKKCWETCGDCKVMITKEVSVCKHEVKVRCSEIPSRARCNDRCPLPLICGHTCQAKCNEPCTTQCGHLVEHDKVADCGHKFKIACHLRNAVLPANSYKLLQFCDAPCPAVLECGHKCGGTCGSCAQGRIHVTCNQKCGSTLVCGHECPFPCREACQPCNRVCSYKCAHSVCSKQCGEPCTRCAESCERHCIHSECAKICGDKCSVPPCTHPCPKKLRCGHDCVGFCGDHCPPLCRVCHFDELTETFFGTEDEEDARFVLLDECGHIVESTGMDQWMTVDDDNAIKYKCCPKCKTPLTSTQRYSDFIKQTLQDVYAVKLKFFGNARDNEDKRAELLDKMLQLETLSKGMPASALLLQKIIKNLKNSVQVVHKGRKITLNTSLNRIYLSKMQVLENIIKAYVAAKLASSTVIDVAIEDMAFLLNCLSREENTMTNQEISDLRKETNRFARKVQLLKITESDEVFRMKIYGNAHNKKLYETIYYKLTSIAPFSDEVDAEIKKDVVYLNKELGTFVTEAERREVVQAMKMSRGHWFKCPNGHYYAIGECGGAMQTGKCIECGVAVGGQSHTLLSTNRHAGEIDGSSHAAWSETANNLFNFEGLFNR